MALTQEQEKFIVKAAQSAAKLFDDLGNLTQINELWFGTPNWQNLITDEELAENPAFVEAGLDKAALADGIYQLSAVRNQILNGNLPKLALLAQFK